MKYPLVVCVTLLTTTLAVQPARAADKITQTMLVTWYGGAYNGRPMAGGDVCRNMGHGDGKFHKNDPSLIAASEDGFAFGTRLQVTNPENGLTIIGMVCDRGSFGPDQIDISEGGARHLHVKEIGKTLLEVEVIE